MARAKRSASGKATEYQIAAPEESVVAECLTALREVLPGKRRITRAQEAYKGPSLNTPFGNLCRNAATYVLGKLKGFPNATAERQAAILKETKRAFNSAILDRFAKSSRNPVKSILSQIHRVTVHPSTVTLFGEGWAAGQYGVEIAGLEDGKTANLTLWEGTRRVQLANRPATPQDRVETWAKRMAKASKNEAQFYRMAIAVLQLLHDKQAEQVPVQQVAQQA